MSRELNIAEKKLLSDAEAQGIAIAQEHYTASKALKNQSCIMSMQQIIQKKHEIASIYTKLKQSSNKIKKLGGDYSAEDLSLIVQRRTA